MFTLIKTYRLNWNNPTFFLYLTKISLPIFWILNISLFLVNICLIFYDVSVDIQQQESFKIFYIHVPLAWLSIFNYCLMVLCSVLFLLLSLRIWIIITYYVSHIGFFFSFLTLSTGSLWGKITWGVWWTWDTRLTSSLILFLFYFIYIFLYKIFSNNFKNYFLLSFFCIFGFVNIPILKFSVDWWNTLHQSQSISSFSLFFHESMFFSLIGWILQYLLFFCLYLFINIRSWILENKIQILKKV